VLDVDLKEHGKSLNVEKCRCSSFMKLLAASCPTLGVGTYGMRTFRIAVPTVDAAPRYKAYCRRKGVGA
jgi:hypothetical protein